MAEVLQVAKRFGKFTFSVILPTVKGKNYSRNMCILFCSQTRKHFQDVPSWCLLLDGWQAVVNENITFQLCSFVHDELPGKCAYFEIKARNVAAQTWK